MLKADEIFSLYLRNTCKKVNAKFYKVIIKFILLFRECLNEYGWHKKEELMAMLKGEKIEIPEAALKHSGLLDGSKISTMHAA